MDDSSVGLLSLLISFQACPSSMPVGRITLYPMPYPDCPHRRPLCTLSFSPLHLPVPHVAPHISTLVVSPTSTTLATSARSAILSFPVLLLVWAFLTPSPLSPLLLLHRPGWPTLPSRRSAILLWRDSVLQHIVAISTSPFNLFRQGNSSFVVSQ